MRKLDANGWVGERSKKMKGGKLENNHQTKKNKNEKKTKNKKTRRHGSSIHNTFAGSVKNEY